jgi:hypothetical protein
MMSPPPTLKARFRPKVSGDATSANFREADIIWHAPRTAGACRRSQHGTSLARCFPY